MNIFEILKMILEYEDLSSIFVSYWPLKQNYFLYYPKLATKQSKKYYYDFLFLINNKHLPLLSLELSKLINWNRQDPVYIIVAVDEKNNRRLVIQSY